MQKQFSVRVLICLLMTLVFWGCYNIEVSQDYDPNHNFNNLKTFAWKYKDQKKTGDMRIDSALMDDRIRKATERNLLAKGFIKVMGENPDFHLVYEYTISRKIYSNPVSTGFGFGYGDYGYGRHGGIGVRTGTEINEYDEGLLIIDFLKPDSDIILWRGKSTRVVETHSTPEKIIQDINKTIEKMLVQFPPN